QPDAGDGERGAGEPRDGGPKRGSGAPAAGTRCLRGGAGPARRRYATLAGAPGERSPRAQRTAHTAARAAGDRRGDPASGDRDSLKPAATDYGVPEANAASAIRRGLDAVQLRVVPALRPGGAELRLEPGHELLHDVGGAGPIDRRGHRRPVVEARQVTHPHGLAYPELEPAEVLKRTREARPPRVGWHARELPTVDEDAPLRRLIQPAQQLHQCRLAPTVLSHDGHHGPRCESEGHVV